MDLFSYLQNGKTAYHSVAETATMLSGAAFNALNEHDVWDLKAGDGFFVQRNSSSLCIQNSSKYTNQRSNCGCHSL